LAKIPDIYRKKYLVYPLCNNALYKKQKNVSFYGFLVFVFIWNYLTFALQKNWKSMFAIVKIAGQQFKVTPGQSLYVPHLQGKQGDELEFSDVLLHDNDGKVSIGGNAGVKVKAEIVNDLVKGEKVIAFKMKRRKGFRKKHGHRTQYTHIKVTGIA
jgi:large subunit ribosomal protein L21